MVPIHQTANDSTRYVDPDEIPWPWREPFRKSMRLRAVPAIRGKRWCAWEHDWEHWVSSAKLKADGPFSPLLLVTIKTASARGGRVPVQQMEIVEVAAVWARPDGHVVDTMQTLVRPADPSQLSSYCIDQPRITQAAVDAAPGWTAVSADLAAFARRHQTPFWGSWGADAKRVIKHQSRRYGVADPLALPPHENLKAAFAQKRRLKQLDMTQAAKLVSLELETLPLGALGDARNLAKLLPSCMNV